PSPLFPYTTLFRSVKVPVENESGLPLNGPFGAAPRERAELHVVLVKLLVLRLLEMASGDLVKRHDIPARDESWLVGRRVRCKQLRDSDLAAREQNGVRRQLAKHV